MVTNRCKEGAGVRSRVATEVRGLRGTVPAFSGCKRANWFTKAA
jgi:hypothetical protein